MNKCPKIIFILTFLCSLQDLAASLDEIETSIDNPIVYEIKGKAMLQDKKGQLRKASIGDILEQNETVITDRNSRVDLMLGENTFAHLGPRSVIKLAHIKKKNTIHLFRGAIRFVQTETDESMVLHTPEGNFRSIGKTELIADYYHSEKTLQKVLALALLKGMVKKDKATLQAGYQSIITENKSTLIKLSQDDAREVGSDQYAFLNKHENIYSFPVELKWKELIPSSQKEKVVSRSIASVANESEYIEVNDLEEALFENKEDFEGEIDVHESIHDLISVAASNVMAKRRWYIRNRVKTNDYLEIAKKKAIEVIALKSFWSTKEKLDKTLELRAANYSQNLAEEKMDQLKSKEIYLALENSAVNEVKREIDSSMKRLNWGLGPLQKEIYHYIYNDLVGAAKKWSYQYALERGRKAYQGHKDTFNLLRPKGVETLTRKIALSLSNDFSISIAKHIARKVSIRQTKQAINEALFLVKPVVQRKIARIYHQKVHQLVMSNLDRSRIRAIASEKGEESKKNLFQYEQMLQKNNMKRRMRNRRN